MKKQNKKSQKLLKTFGKKQNKRFEKRELKCEKIIITRRNNKNISKNQNKTFGINENKNVNK